MTRGIKFEIPEWAKKHVYEVCKRENECECEEEECYCFPSYVDLGNSDYWPCYLRLMFIAAYRMIQSQPNDQNAPNKPSKDLVLSTILQVCPPTTNNIPVSALQEAMYRMVGGMGLGIGMRRGDVGCLHLKRCLEKTVQSVLAAAGLEVLCQLCSNHESLSGRLSPGTISSLAELLAKLEPFFTRVREDLAGTPYDNDEYYNLDESGQLSELQYAIALVARLDSGIVGEVM